MSKDEVYEHLHYLKKIKNKNHFGLKKIFFLKVVEK